MVLRDRIMTAIGTLGLYGMKSTLDEVLAAGIKSRATPEKIICDLLEAEMAERKVRSIRYRMSLARFQWTRIWTALTSQQARSMRCRSEASMKDDSFPITPT